MRVPGAHKNTGTKLLSMRSLIIFRSKRSENGNDFVTPGGGADAAKK